jgi:hypothetical protein
MTAKEALIERVGQLSEEDAAEWLARLESEDEDEDELSEDELAEALAGRAENERGDSVSATALFARYGL